MVLICFGSNSCGTSANRFRRYASSAPASQSNRRKNNSLRERFRSGKTFATFLRTLYQLLSTGHLRRPFFGRGPAAPPCAAFWSEQFQSESGPDDSLRRLTERTPYILEIQRSGNLLIPAKRITAIWKEHINRRIWCSHLYVRQLMDLGVEPPLTGRVQINPWADFNLSGQFVSESWGLISPGMPQTAARTGLHYTHVSVDGEAVQSTQMMDAMMATSFLTSDMNRILDAGAAALDPASVMSGIVSDVRKWHKSYPKDWRTTRRLTQEKYCRYGTDMRDRNGVWLNGASTIAALLYGDGDFVGTLNCAFNLGWDADNNAAAAGAIVGVLRGNRWMTGQGWNIKDAYRNTSRDHMPDDETITSFGDRLIDLARRNIAARGGAYGDADGKPIYRIPVEEPSNVEPLRDPKRQAEELRESLRGEIEKGILASNDLQQIARAAYLAICLDLAAPLMTRHPDNWAKAVSALNQYAKVLQVIFYQSPFPAGTRLAEKAASAGLRRPEKDNQI